MAPAQLQAIESAARTEDGRELHPRLVEQYGYRARAAERYSGAEADLLGHRQEHFGAVVAEIRAGRTEPVRLHRAGGIHDEVLHQLENELGLEELTARRFVRKGCEVTRQMTVSGGLRMFSPNQGDVCLAPHCRRSTCSRLIPEAAIPSSGIRIQCAMPFI